MAVLAMVAMLGVTPARVHAQAQSASSGQDLTLPPDLRQDAPPPRQVRKPLRHRHVDRAPVTTEGPSATERHAAAPDPHPVDLGVTMRGGSGTPRVYGATGTSEAIQESGSGFGAAMKFGF